MFSLYHCACVLSEQVDSFDLDETDRGIQAYFFWILQNYLRILIK